MNHSFNKTDVGYFLKRTDLPKPSVVDLLRELKNHLFEAKIMLLALEAFYENDALSFDCSVGDWKCQTRASMIVDLIQNFSIEKRLFLRAEMLLVQDLVIRLEVLIEKIANMNSVECQNLSRQQLQKIFLSFFLKENKVDYAPSGDLGFLSLCFLATLKNHKKTVFACHQMSINKIKAVINTSKTMLCRLSINYEQSLAKEYELSDELIMLQQVEFKGMQYMTSLFAGFRAIFEKMKKRGQGFLIKDFNFCQCGGISKLSTHYFVFQSGSLEEDVLPFNLDQVVTIMLVFQFPGSMVQLQNNLGVSNDEVDIPKEYYQRCLCAQPSMQQKINSIEEAIMAFFAQHPQFTNGSQINWDGFGLADSELKKEYDYLLTLPGFSRNDMSKFQIIHMYPDTIKNVLHEQKELLAKLNLKFFHQGH